MEGDQSAPGESQLSDIQTYLASFNKEISDGTGQPIQVQGLPNQEYILQQGDFNNVGFIAQDGSAIATTDGSAMTGGATLTVVQANDGTTQLVVTSPPGGDTTSHQGALKQEAKAALTQLEPVGEQAALMSPAQPDLQQQGQGEVTMQLSDGGAPAVLKASGEAESILTIQPQVEATVSSAAPDANTQSAVQVLANVAATSIPQVQEGGTAAQMVAVQNMQDSSQPQLVAVSGGAQAQTVKQAESVANGDQSSVVLNTGGSYQTVTIVPSEVNQGGEVSYVLIVSQPDGEGKDDDTAMEDVDMSVYDFKEERGAREEYEEEDGMRKIIRVTPKRTPQGLQAQLMCNYCNYTSPKRYLLTRHMKTHSEERPHKCNICDRGFKTVASLQNHINTHTGVRPHKCKECDSAFTTSGELVRHVRYRHTYEKPHKCTECDYSSVELSKLKRHMRSHTGERPYQCPHCTYASPDTYKLKRHLRIHTGEKPYECDVCQARFTQSNSLKAHKLIHTGNKPVFQCELCPTTCGRKTDLKIHVQKLHTSDKPLQCKKCGKSFPDRYTYKIHLKTHDGEKCFKCELCPYAALSQRHLESHILTHTGEKPYQCDECDQSFRQKQLLRRHKNLYHTPDYVPPPPREKTHECAECHKTFAHRGNLLRHMGMHDPDNPNYGQDIDEEEEDYTSEEEDALGNPERVDEVQLVQVVQGEVHQVVEHMTADSTPARRGRGRPRAQPQVLHLVTEDGQNAQQILLQMEEGDVLEDDDEDEEPSPQEVDTPPAKRGRGRPPKAPREPKVEKEDEDEVLSPKRGRGRGKRRSEDDDDNVDDTQPGVRGRKRSGLADGDESPKKKVRGTPKKGQAEEEDEEEDDRKKEVQKQRDIEECFGFDVEEDE